MLALKEPVRHSHEMVLAKQLLNFSWISCQWPSYGAYWGESYWHCPMPWFGECHSQRALWQGSESFHPELLARGHLPHEESLMYGGESGAPLHIAEREGGGIYFHFNFILTYLRQVSHKCDARNIPLVWR